MNDQLCDNMNCWNAAVMEFYKIHLCNRCAVEKGLIAPNDQVDECYFPKYDGDK